MFSAETQAIMEAEKKDFVNTKMWFGVGGNYNNSYFENMTSSIMTNASNMVCDYNTMSIDFGSTSQYTIHPTAFDPLHHQKSIKMPHIINPSTKGRRSGSKNQYRSKGPCLRKAGKNGTEESQATFGKSKVKVKKVIKKQPSEPKLNQLYKQSVNPSKRHRDRLNKEIYNLAKLLPFPEDERAGLDKLSILRLSVSYLRNKNFFKGLVSEKVVEIKKEKVKTHKLFSNLLNEALDGFVLVVTCDGEIFYASEKVKDYLGRSQSEVLHEPLEKFVYDDYREELTSQLKGTDLIPKIEVIENEADLNDERSIVGQHREFTIQLKCVLKPNSSIMYKPFKIKGTVRELRIEPEVDNICYALFAFVSPAQISYNMLQIRMKSTLFCSKNRIDLSFIDLDQRGKEFFGYSKKDIFGRSSYVLVHRGDIQHLRCKHTEIMSCGKTSLGTFRLLDKNNEWNWVCGYGRVVFKNGKPDYLVTTNRIMSEEEGLAMLKLRDTSDENALKSLGLIEPEDSNKAIELGFPSKNALQPFDSSKLGDCAPIPMPLGAFSSKKEIPCQAIQSSGHTVQEETADLLKGALFDVDTSEQFLNLAAGQIMSEPLNNLSLNDLHRQQTKHSPHGSVSSEFTHISNNSSNSGKSACGGEQSYLYHQKLNDGFHPSTVVLSKEGQSHTSVFTELHPVHHLSSQSSSSSISITPEQQQQHQQQHYPLNMVDSQLYPDLSNLDLLRRQQHQLHEQHSYSHMRMNNCSSVNYQSMQDFNNLHMFSQPEAVEHNQHHSSFNQSIQQHPQQRMFLPEQYNSNGTQYLQLPEFYNVGLMNRMNIPAPGMVLNSGEHFVGDVPPPHSSVLQYQMDLLNRNTSGDEHLHQKQFFNPSFSVKNNDRNIISYNNWMSLQHQQSLSEQWRQGFNACVNHCSPDSSSSSQMSNNEQYENTQYGWMPV